MALSRSTSFAELVPSVSVQLGPARTEVDTNAPAASQLSSGTLHRIMPAVAAW